MQQLSLAGDRIGDAGVKSLGPPLAHLRSFQQPDVSHNFIGTCVAKSLGPHLAHLTSI